MACRLFVFVALALIANAYCQIINNGRNIGASGCGCGCGCQNYGVPVGYGDVSIAGELPVSGCTTVGGQVPVIGYVNFEGYLPANGLVSVTPTCGCGCGCGR